MSPAPLPDATIRAVAHSVHARTSAYGFSIGDHVRLVTELLSLCEQDSEAGGAAASGAHDAAVHGRIGMGRRKGDAQLPLAGPNVRIRELERPRDLGVLEQWMHEDYALGFLATAGDGIGAIDLAALLDGPRNRFALFTTPADEPIGLVAYLNHHPEFRRAEVAVYLGATERRGRGFGAEALGAWLRYGAAGFGLRKVYALLLEADIRSIELYRGLGFVPEGVLREEVRSVGDAGHVMRLALLLEATAGDA